MRLYLVSYFFSENGSSGFGSMVIGVKQKYRNSAEFFEHVKKAAFPKKKKVRITIIAVSDITDIVEEG